MVIKVMKKKHGGNTTDNQLLVKSYADYEQHDWDSSKIVDALRDECKLSKANAEQIAKEVYEDLVSFGRSEVDIQTLKMIINYHLLKNGFDKKLGGQISVGMSLYDMDALIHQKSADNSNISKNNPGAIDMFIAENSFRRYALRKVFSKDVSDAHLEGLIYLHDLGSGTSRSYCSAHSVRAIAMKGLGDYFGFDVKSAPAKHAQTLVGHINTFVCSIASYFAGAIGLDFVNIYFAPYVEGMTHEEMKQIAQYLIFSLSQSAFSRGGQSLHPTELIWVKRNGKYESVEIGKFADELIDNDRENVQIDAKGYEIYKTDKLGFEAISFTKKDGKVENKPIKYVARMPHSGKMYKIHTSNGIVNVTGDHSLFEFKGAGNIVPTKVKELKEGSYIVVPHNANNINDLKDTVNILDYFDEEMLSIRGAKEIIDNIKAKYGKDVVAKLREIHGCTRHILRDGLKMDKVRFPLAKHFVNLENAQICLKGDSQATMKPILKLDYDLGYLAGMYCSEGHNSHKFVIISNRDEGLLKKVTDILDKKGYSWYRTTENDTYAQNCGNVTICGILGLFLQNSCSENKTKIIPNWVLDANLDCVKGFLKGFFDGDGNNRKTENEKNVWGASNTSRKVIAGLGLLMLRLEKETLVYLSTQNSERNPNWKDCYEIREALSRKVNPFTGYNTTAASFNKYRNKLEKEIVKDVDWLIDSDLSVSIVKKIEEYDYEGPVYDISVPETEAFLGGTGNIFFKNTLFLDTNVFVSVPYWLKKVQAVGPGGKLMTKIDENGNEVPRTYADYEETAQKFLSAMLDVWEKGDKHGTPFAFPKCLGAYTQICVKMTSGVKVMSVDAFYKIYEKAPKDEAFYLPRPGFNGVSEWVKIKDMKPRGEETGLRFSFGMAEVVECTKDHKFKIYDGATKQIVDKEAKDVVPGQDQFLFYGALPFLDPSKRKRGFTDAQLWFAGFFFAKGSIYYEERLLSVEFAKSAEADVIRRIEACGLPYEKRSNGNTVCYKITKSNRFVETLFKAYMSLRGTSVNDKERMRRIPSFAFELDYQDALKFMHGFMTCNSQEYIKDIVEQSGPKSSSKGISIFCGDSDNGCGDQVFIESVFRMMGLWTQPVSSREVFVKCVSKEDYRKILFLGEGRYDELDSPTFPKQFMYPCYSAPKESVRKFYAIEVDHPDHDFLTAHGLWTKNCDLHVSQDCFEDEKAKALLKKACKVSSVNGSPYFIFDHDSLTLSACCFTGDTKVVAKNNKGFFFGSFADLAEETKDSNALTLFDRGWRPCKVVKTTTGGRKVYALTVAGRGTMKVTSDHVFPTLNGDKKAEKITTEDWIETNYATFTFDQKNDFVGKSQKDYDNGKKLGEFVSGKVDKIPAKLKKFIGENGGLKNETIEASVDFRTGLLDGLGVYDKKEPAIAKTKEDAEIAQIIATTLGFQVSLNENRIIPQDFSHGRDVEWKRENGKLYYRVKEIVETNETPEFVYCFSMNREPYFILPNGIVSHNCRLRTKLEDESVLTEPERIRFSGIQNVTTNLPQCAYRSKGDWKLFYKYLSDALELAKKAHLQKKKFLESISQKPGDPMWAVCGETYFDGKPYIDLNKGTYIFGLIGLNNALKYMTGKEMHEDEEIYEKGMDVIAYMLATINKFKKETGLKMTIEESPAESASRRLAKCDLQNYPEAKDIVNGSIEDDDVYYCNSVHFRPDVDMPFVERLFKQSAFHNMIESGAMVHAFCGEKLPDPDSLFTLLEKTFKETPCAQMVVSPEFTICEKCGRFNGLHDKCPKCGSEKVDQITRIVGYYSKVQNWNKSKIREGKDRQKGDYRI